MTIDEKILKLYHFKENNKKAKDLYGLLPVNEILVVKLKFSYLIYASTFITDTPIKFLKTTLESIKAANPHLKHKVTMMSLKRVKARHEQLKEIKRLAS